MIYTLEHGVQKTLTEKIWHWLEYGLLAGGFALLALLLGNIWYSARYNPSIDSGSPSASKPVTVQTARNTQTVTPATGDQSGTVTVPNSTSSSSFTSTPMPQSDASAGTMTMQPATGGLGGGGTTVGGGAGTGTATGDGAGAGSGTDVPVTDPVPTDPPVVTDPPTSDPGTGDGITVTVPPITITVPLIDTGLQTPGLSVGL